jgi:hypothetical protein
MYKNHSTAEQHSHVNSSNLNEASFDEIDSSCSVNNLESQAAQWLEAAGTTSGGKPCPESAVNSVVMLANFDARKSGTKKSAESGYWRIFPKVCSHYEQTGEILNTTEIARLYKTSNRTAVPVSLDFRARLAMQSFAYSINAKYPHLFANHHHRSEEDKKKLRQAELAMLNSPSDCRWLLTIVCPSDSIAAYLISNNHSTELLSATLNHLLHLLNIRSTPLDKLFFSCSKEVQQCGRLHMHIWIELPGINLSYKDKLHRALKDAWSTSLDNFARTYESFSFFISRSNKSLRFTDDFCHVTEFQETTQRSYRDVYGALDKQPSGRYIQLNEKWMFVNIRESVYISPALKRLLKQQTHRFELSQLYAKSIHDLVASLGYQWHTERRYGDFRLPDKTRIKHLEHHLLITDALQTAQQATSSMSPLIASKLVKLLPDGYLTIGPLRKRDSQLRKLGNKTITHEELYT